MQTKEAGPYTGKEEIHIIQTARPQMNSQEKPCADLGSRSYHNASYMFRLKHFHTAFALSAAKANLQQTMSVSSEFDGAVSKTTSRRPLMAASRALRLAVLPSIAPVATWTRTNVIHLVKT